MTALAGARRNLLLAGALLWLAAFALRLDAVWRAPAPVGGDARDYDRLARHLATGEGFCLRKGKPTSYRPPFYPVFVSAVYGLSGPSPRVVGAVEAAIGAAVVILLVVVARWAISPMAGTIAGLVSCVYPTAVEVYFGPGTLYSETLYSALISATQSMLIAWWVTAQRRWLVTAGALLGLGALTKAGALLLPVFLVPACLAAPIGTFRRRATDGVVLVAVALACVLPWTVRNAWVHSAFVPVSTNLGLSLYWSNNLQVRGDKQRPASFDPRDYEGLSEVEQSREMTRRAWNELRAQPERIPWLLLGKWIRLFDPSFTFGRETATRFNLWYVWLLPFAMAGLWWGLRNGEASQRAIAWTSLAITAHYSLTLLAFHGAVRYRFWFEPAGLLVALVGLNEALRRWPAHARWGAVIWLLLCALTSWWWPVVRPWLGAGLRIAIGEW